MRVASFRVRHGIFHHLAGLGIELPDISREICRVPDVAVLVRQQPVWPGLRRQLVLLELFGLRIEMSQHVGKLPRIPDRPIRSQHRIVRPRSRRRHHPLFDRNVRAAGNNLRFRLWLGREILGQVIQHCAELGIRYRRSDVDHHVQDRLPVVVVMSRVRHLRQRVANGAVALHYGLAVAFRQIHRLLVSILSARRKNCAERSGQQEQPKGGNHSLRHSASSALAKAKSQVPHSSSACEKFAISVQRPPDYAAGFGAFGREAGEKNHLEPGVHDWD